MYMYNVDILIVQKKIQNNEPFWNGNLYIILRWMFVLEYVIPQTYCWRHRCLQDVVMSTPLAIGHPIHCSYHISVGSVPCNLGEYISTQLLLLLLASMVYTEWMKNLRARCAVTTTWMKWERILAYCSDKSVNKSEEKSDDDVKPYI